MIAIVGILAALCVAGVGLWPGSSIAVRVAARWRSAPVVGGALESSGLLPAAKPKSELPVKATDIKINQSGWYSWALLETRTGKMSGSADRSTLSTTASLIKPWIAADFLRRAAEQGLAPSEDDLEQIESMIRDSDNEAAEALYIENGRDESIRRLISTCGLEDSRVSDDGGWSRTLLSSADITRLGACIADGRAAGPTWTGFLLDQMRAVTGMGDFGIRKAFPENEQSKIAIKNGWVDRDEEQEYHVSCMAIGDGWVVGVMTRYEIDKGYEYGAKICELVGQELREAAGG
ncbi:MAG TPA: serine hydrolase [Asanoa sp.]|nr:serine hydrolase [Asanoa sp.]